ncbi:hypothetical protein LTR56_018990 [Elasticomyces elasticus]|nr:hypothetical protein LTR56_018990 [Elasticomyces elasticus]KAK3635542.1 hypothetical protein LTR22_019110 [Elasticomyces elasticus]KAK4911755.1 hypothetical protein LTR49_019745 [Elasticomyces elasticus]KAK5769792.1 hypothetical protein LTS12_000242 [Elasticomyces elasticus]
MVKIYLEEIPQEMLDHIATYCDTDSFLTLRATSKTIRDTMDKAFINRYFKKRSHLYSIFGLMKLVDISASRLNKHIEEIELVSQDLCISSSINGSATDYVTGQRSLALWTGECGIIRNSSLGQQCLESVLYNLRKDSCIVAFRGTAVEDGVQPYGAATRMKQIKVTKLVDVSTIETCTGSNWSDMMTAPISQLHIRSSRPSKPYTTLQFPRISDYLWDRPSSAFVELRSLHLDLGWAHWEKDTWDSFKSFIIAAPNLESVAIEWSWSNVEAEENDEPLVCLGFILANLNLPGLELSLGPCWVTEESLVHLLSRRMRKLRSLRLVNVGLSNDCSWRRVLQALAVRNTLDTIELENLWKGELIGQRHSLVLSPTRDGQLKHQGQATMREALVKTAEDATYLDESTVDPPLLKIAEAQEDAEVDDAVEIEEDEEDEVGWRQWGTKAPSVAPGW